MTSPDAVRQQDLASPRDVAREDRREPQHARVPLVSIVIPAFNAAATLEQTLESLYAQTYRRVEIVLVDDGSTDNTPEVLARHAGRVKVIRQANAGLAGARNTGLRAARGDYIALMDADDLCAPDRIEVQAAFLEAMPDVQLCVSDFSAFGAQGRIAESFLRQYYSAARRAGSLDALFGSRRDMALGRRGSVATYAGNVFEPLAFGNFLHPPTVMFRRQVLDRVGLLSQSYRNICDYEWMLRVSRQGRIGLIDASLLDYRISPTQMSGDHNTLQVKLDTLQLIDWLREVEPGFHQRHAAAFRSRVADMHIGAANACAEADRARGAAHLWQAFRHGARLGRIARIALKLALPVARVRSVRARLRAFEWRPVVRGVLTRAPLLRRAATAGHGRPGGGYWNARDPVSYAYGLWIKHLALLRHCGMELPQAVAEVGPGDSLALGIAALLSGARTYHAYDVKAFSCPAEDAARVPLMARLFASRTPFPADGWPDVHAVLGSGLEPATHAWAAADTRPERQAAIAAALEGATESKDAPVAYVTPWECARVPREAYDLVLSHSVLEYVEDLDTVFASMAMMLKPGGWMSHQVDFSSLGITHAWNGHLAYGPFAWWLVRGRRRHAPNRRLASEYLSALDRHGFEVVWSARYEDALGLGHADVAATFRAAPPRDIGCHSLFVVARRRCTAQS